MYFGKRETMTNSTLKKDYSENKINFVTHVLQFKNTYWLETQYNWFTNNLFSFILVNPIMIYYGNAVS